MTYGRLANELHEHGLALHNLASLPHISVGGAIATGTHGSGDRLGNLATAVSAIDILRSDGELVHLERGQPDFDGAVVGLGALGVVLRVRLDLEPEYQIEQRVYEGLAWDQLVEHFDAVTGAGDSVSVFTTWGDHVDQVWVKARPPGGGDTLFDARRGDRRRSPDCRCRSPELHTSAGCARAVVGSVAALQDGLHTEQRRRTAVRAAAAPFGRARCDIGRAWARRAAWHRTCWSARSGPSPPTRCG